MAQSLSGLIRALIDPDPTPRTPVKPDISRAATTGMVQCGSLTFSIWRLSENQYGVVRVIDDQYLGSFEAAPRIVTYPEPGVDNEHLRKVARQAKRCARATGKKPAGGQVRA